MKTCTFLIPGDTHTNFDEQTLFELSQFVVVNIDNKNVKTVNIIQQFEFLARAAWIAKDCNWMRSRFCNIFPNYKTGDFKRSRIRLLERSNAIHFNMNKDEPQFIYYKLTEHIIKIKNNYESNRRSLCN